MKLYIKIILIIIALAVVFALVYVSCNSRKGVCSEFVVKIENNSEQLITVEEIKDSVYSSYAKVEGRQMDSIDVKKISQILISNPYIRTAKVYKSLNSKIIAEIETRCMLVRINTIEGNSFILDEYGTIVPVRKNNPVRVLQAGGFLKNIQDTLVGKSIITMKKEEYIEIEKLKDVYNIALNIQRDHQLYEMISQVYASNDLTYILVPVIGDFYLNYGRADNFERKNNMIRILYTKILPYYNMDVYSSADISLKNQIVFTKKSKIYEQQ